MRSILNSEKQFVEGEAFTLQTLKKDNLVFYTISDTVRDKKKVAKHADKLIESKLQATAKLAHIINNTTITSLSAAGCDTNAWYYSTSSFNQEGTDTVDATVRSLGTHCFAFQPYTFHDNYTIGVEGTQRAQWLAADPWLPDQIVLYQKPPLSE